VSQKLFNHFYEHTHIVVRLLTRCVNERDIPASGVSDQLPQEVRFAI
jgi:hypothetical protein